VKALPFLLENFINIFAIMIFYAIIGLHIFKGAFEYRCRISDTPINGETDWPVAENINYLCGNWKCPQETYCRAPINYNLEWN